MPSDPVIVAELGVIIGVLFFISGTLGAILANVRRIK